MPNSPRGAALRWSSGSLLSVVASDRLDISSGLVSHGEGNGSGRCATVGGSAPRCTTEPTGAQNLVRTSSDPWVKVGVQVNSDLLAVGPVIVERHHAEGAERAHANRHRTSKYRNHSRRTRQKWGFPSQSFLPRDNRFRWSSSNFDLAGFCWEIRVSTPSAPS